jgi:hypothetical protein
MTLACLLILFSCSAPLPQDRGNWPSTRISATLAVKALHSLREGISAGRCDAIYAEAADEFRERQPRQAWLNICQDLQSWSSVTVLGASIWENHTARIHGIAAFPSGTCGLETIWRLDRGQARLFELRLPGMVVVPERPTPRLEPPVDPPSAGPGSITAYAVTQPWTIFVADLAGSATEDSVSALFLSTTRALPGPT